MELADESLEEDRDLGHVWYRRGVSSGNLCDLGGGFANKKSICCISVTRLCYSDRILTKDQTYTMVFLECLTMVEPLLGIVLACIPIARPAVIKIGQSSAVTLSLRRLRSTLTNSRQRGPDSIHSSSSSAEINKKSFHRLEENVYPLSDMARTVNNVESPAAARKDPYSSYHDSDMPPIGAISVTKTWDSGSATAV